MLKKGFLLFLLSGSLLCIPLPASAHRVNVFAYVEGSTCHVEGYYSRSRRAENAKVEVFDREGQKLLEGKTDSEGNFSFHVSEKADLRIVLTASLGHTAEFVLQASEIQGDAEGVQQPSKGPEPEPKREMNASGEATSLSDREKKLLDRIDGLLVKRLKPVYFLVERIEEDRNRISDRDVIAGIGYIVGIFGIAAYAAARRRKR